jgi:hypothetical protein
MRFFLFVMIFITFSYALKGQNIQEYNRDTTNQKKGLKYILLETPWYFQVGINSINDGGKRARGLFDFKSMWNTTSYPSRISVEKLLTSGLSAELAVSFNSYRSGEKFINGKTATTGSFICVDLNGKYRLNKILGDLRWFDPYLGLGYGFTERTFHGSKNITNINFGAGSNFWLHKNVFALNIQCQAKIATQSDFFKNKYNYLQNSVGLVYVFNRGNNKEFKKAKKHIKEILQKNNSTN